MFLPKIIQKEIGNRSLHMDQIGCSGAQVYLMENLVLKIEPAEDCSNKALAMMQWLKGELPVPEVVAEEVVSGTRYLLMTRLPGQMACDESYLEQPMVLIEGLAQGLEMLKTVDVAGCPVDQSLVQLLAQARVQVEQNLVDMENVEPETFGKDGFPSPARLLDWLEENRPQEEAGLIHGDYCLPNVFLKNGRVSGFLDLGRCGVGDPYLDIALCWRSIRDNFNGRHGYYDPEVNPDVLFKVLGMRPDLEKIRYYLLLDELF